LDRAAIVLAGVLCEMLFDADFRLGSSLDEIALFNGISANIAVKTGAEIVEVQAGIILRAANIVRHNRAIVLRIAQKLEWRKTLREREIAGLLAGVVEAAP